MRISPSGLSPAFLCDFSLQLPLHSSQPPPFSPPQLPLMALRPFMTPILMPAMTKQNYDETQHIV